MSYAVSTPAPPALLPGRGLGSFNFSHNAAKSNDENLLMARVHRGRYRQVVASIGLLVAEVPDVALIACPRCGDEYFADLERGAEP